MNVLLIAADANMHKFMLFGKLKSAREAPLTLTTLAAIGSVHPDIRFSLIDESVDRVPVDARPDLVGISVLTGTARRAYAIADHFRRRGIPVVLGGVHVTLMPEEALSFADAVVVGMAEETWPQLLADFKAGTMKKIYRQGEPREIFDMPTPRYDLQRKSGYMLPYVVQTTRGCMHSCDFCTVPSVWSKYMRRPVSDVVRDIRAIPSGRFVISDVSPFDDVEHSKELLKAIIPLKKKWGGLATSRITDDPELFDLLVKSGCQFLLIGFESINQKNLNTIYKGFNKEINYPELMRRLHDARIVVQGCFVFGFDEDGPDVFEKTVQHVQELNVDIPRYSFYTPYPGTRLFQRLEQEKRILSYDWGEYDTMHVVFRPKQMSPFELYEGFRYAYRETFRFRNILSRAFDLGMRFPITVIGNVIYRNYVRRLAMTKGFEMPLSHSTHDLSRNCDDGSPDSSGS